MLVIGASGQIGTVLSDVLRQQYGTGQVLCTDLRPPATAPEGPFETLDATDAAALAAVVARHGITQVYHLAAVLSARGEQNPLWAWELNMKAWLNVLEVSRQQGVQRVFFPSSIAVFGQHADLHRPPQHGPLHPVTVYGISKAAGENWGQYYFLKYGLDVRSLRYPGIIGHESLPGGGTTDYAVDIFHQALQHHRYTCFLRADTRLPMMYMPDAIRATLELMAAPAAALSVRTAYNLAAMSFTPAELAAAIRAHLPDFQVTYVPDFRQQIAEGWPHQPDDTAARTDWGWRPRYDLTALTADMLRHLEARYPAVHTP